MTLTPMQYKGYVWPHNPRTYTISYRRQVVAHKLPFGRYALQDLGLCQRVMEGEGAFTGPTAYAQFKKLAAVFYQRGSGLLFHPVWQSSRAYFVRLRLTQEPRADYVRYAFTFWEEKPEPTLIQRTDLSSETVQTVASAGGSDPGETWVTVRAGETIWSIARRVGVTAGEILGKNPTVKNPNILTPGQRLKVR